MWITYRRTGSALGLMAVLAVAVFTIAVAAFAVIAAVVLAPVALLARAMRPASRRNRRAPSASPWPANRSSRERWQGVSEGWPHETIEAEVVSAARSSDEGDLLRLDSDKG
jgi:hypothetical protein